MARVLFGSLVTAVKGSIGGVTFQNNPSGSIIRSRPHLSRVSTVKQTAAHVKLENQLYDWQVLEQGERDMWNEYASVWVKENKFGESKTLTGLNWFISVNFWQNLVDHDKHLVPPDHTLPPAPPSFSMIMSDSDIKILALESFDYDNNSLILWTSLPTKRNTLSINQIRKYVMQIESLPDTPVSIKNHWKAATGLNWNPSVNFPSANIFICIQSISKDSNITSSMLCTKNNTPSATDDSIYYYT